MSDSEFCSILPVEEFRDELMTRIRENQIIICVGETGSGKTTKIPQFFLDSEILQGKIVGVTQPRRVAAITVAQRVAEERNVTVGDEVGYSVRFDECTSTNTKIKFMTDGILVRECLRSPDLLQYQAIMLDEAHERSIHTDILFGLVKVACRKRPDLKVVVTSATLDVTKFASYFNNCPIVRVPGRMYPVDLYHSKIAQVMTTSGPATSAYVDSAVQTVMKIHSSREAGHVLVFLTGQEEIERACELIRRGVRAMLSDDSDVGEMLVLPLYASLSPQNQKKAFQPPPNGVRKCVVATNIAETSVTVPGIRFVVDTGYVKQKVYDPTRHMESLLVVPISQVSALQRAGRAGRTGPGQCYRLYSTECFQNFADETIPEIKRCNLTNTLLYLKALGIKDVMGFDFMDPPSEQQMVEGLLLLHMFGALDDDGNITAEVGRPMSVYPLEPTLSRMMVEAAKSENDCVEEMATICAMLSAEQIFHFPRRTQRFIDEGQSQSHDHEQASEGGHNHGHGGGRREGRGGKGRVLGTTEEELERHAVEDAHSRLRRSKGDHFTYLHIYQEWTRTGCSVEWCESNYVRHRALKLAKNIRGQLLGDAESARNMTTGTSKKRSRESEAGAGGRHGDRDSRGGDKHDQRTLEKAVQRCLVSGLFMNAGRRCANETAYRSMNLKLGRNEQQLLVDDPWGLHDMLEDVKLMHPHPTCGFSEEGVRPPEYVVYQELLLANRALMRHVAKVEFDMLDACQKRWRFVHPLVLSDRELPRRRQAQSHNTSSAEAANGDCGGTIRNSDASSRGAGVEEVAEMKTSAVEAARARYLQRKKV